MADDFRYHIDHHGSLVRPPGLLAARATGDPQALARAEEQAVTAAAHAQRRLVLSAVGDGQFRREHFESVVYEHIATNAGFAASADRPLLSEDAQHAKLRLVETVARYYWGNEI